MTVGKQPIIYLVRQFDAEIVGRSVLVEDHVFPTTGASEITAVVYGKPQVLYVLRLTMQHEVCLDVGTPVLVTVPV
jgi:hypothetical protein